jgi:cbb3-type cytochrome oxidase maturation protein
MESSLYILIPLSLLLVLAIGLILWWAVRGGQFDDLEGPGFRILMDDDLPKVQPVAEPVAKPATEATEPENGVSPGQKPAG